MSETQRTDETTPAAKGSRRPRKAENGAAASQAAETRGTQGELSCPECGRTFTRAAALGAHRRTHGVSGNSRGAVRGRAARSKAKTSTSRRSSGSRSRSGSASSNSVRSGGSGPSGAINRDALLQVLLPKGVPARFEAIRAVGAWLEEAERLARLR